MISKEIKKCICKDRNDGKSYGQIVKIYGLSKATIQRIVSSFGKVFKKRGPKYKITKFEQRKIISFINDQNKIGLKVTCKKIQEELNLNVHRTTVLRTLQTLTYDYKKLPYKFKMSTATKQKRVKICKKWLIENINWNSVIFSDEKRFSLFGCDSYCTWIHTKQNPARVKKVIRSPGVMVWAMMLSIRSQKIT